MKYRVVHKTIYQYEDSVTLTQNEARLRPRTMTRQTVHETDLSVFPSPRGGALPCRLFWQYH